MKILLHLLDTPRETVELQLVARTELGLEVQLRTKTAKLAIVHDAWKQSGERERVKETERKRGDIKRERNGRLKHKERRQRWCK